MSRRSDALSVDQSDAGLLSIEWLTSARHAYFAAGLDGFG